MAMMYVPMNIKSAQHQKKKAQNEESNKRLHKLMEEMKTKKIHEEVLMKRSKHLKQWRQRQLILTQSMIGSFQIKGGSIHATEWIPLVTIESCSIPAAQKNDPVGKFMLSFFGEDKHQAKLNFRYACPTKQSRAKWIELIKKHSPKCSK